MTRVQFSYIFFNISNLEDNRQVDNAAFCCFQIFPANILHTHKKKNQQIRVGGLQ